MKSLLNIHTTGCITKIITGLRSVSKLHQLLKHIPLILFELSISKLFKLVLICKSFVLKHMYIHKFTLFLNTGIPNLF